MSQANRDKQKKLRARAGETATPVKSTRQAGGNRRAQAILRKLQRQKGGKVAQHPTYKSASSRTLNAGGIKSADNFVKNKQTGTVQHDLEFSRSQAVGNPDSGTYPEYEPRKNISKENARLRQANIKYQQGELMDRVPVGDDVIAQPVESASGRNPRARLYDRATKGALKPTTTYYGDNNQYQLQEIKATKGPGNKWNNPANAGPVEFDPKSLKQDLKGMAARKAAAFLGGPVVSGIMTADSAIHAATGKRPSEHVASGTLDTFRQAVRSYQSKGSNFNVGSIMPY